jgi:hypothetical protein
MRTALGNYQGGWRPCGESNAGFCLRRATLYPLSYRGGQRLF